MQDLVTVTSIMRREFPVIDKSDTLDHAYKLMRKYDIDRVVAVANGRVVGMVTKKDVMIRLATLRTRNIAPARLYVSSVMTINPITAPPDMLAVKAARIMVDKDISSIPIVEEDMKPLGLLTKWEIVKLCLNDEDEVAEIMTPNPVVIGPGDRLLHARRLMVENSISTLPVIEEGRLIGIITIEEVADAFYEFHSMVPAKYRKERIMHLIVEDVMRLRPLTASPTDKIGVVASRMLERGMRAAVVMEGDEVIGVLTITDLTRKYATPSL